MENPYFSYTNPVKFEIRGEAQIRANMPEDFVNRWKNDRVGNLGFFPGNSIFGNFGTEKYLWLLCLDYMDVQYYSTAPFLPKDTSCLK